jgi:hypothetical protein
VTEYEELQGPIWIRTLLYLCKATRWFDASFLYDVLTIEVQFSVYDAPIFHVACPNHLFQINSDPGLKILPSYSGESEYLRKHSGESLHLSSGSSKSRLIIYKHCVR